MRRTRAARRARALSPLDPALSSVGVATSPPRSPNRPETFRGSYGQFRADRATGVASDSEGLGTRNVAFAPKRSSWLARVHARIRRQSVARGAAPIRSGNWLLNSLWMRSRSRETARASPHSAPRSVRIRLSPHDPNATRYVRRGILARKSTRTSRRDDHGRATTAPLVFIPPSSHQRFRPYLAPRSSHSTPAARYATESRSARPPA